MSFYGASQKITPQQRAQANIKSAQAVQAYNAGQKPGGMPNQMASAQAAQQMQAPSAPPPPPMLPNAAAAMQGGQQSTAQAAQQLLGQGTGQSAALSPQAPQQPSLYQGMVDQGAQAAGGLANLQQAGDQMAGQQNQMQRQADLMRAAQMRGTRTPAAAMGQMGAIQNSAAAQNPYASMLQSAKDSYAQRGWGIDPTGGGFTHPPAGQAAGAAQDWGKAMQSQQNQNMGSLPGWAQSQVRGGSAAPSWGGHW